MLTWIAIANALVWSGVITFLLLFLVQNSLKIETQAATLEAARDREADKLHQ